MKIEIGNVLGLTVLSATSKSQRRLFDRKDLLEMRALIQRVSRASVSVDNSIVVQIDKGLLILVGFTEGDTEEKIRWIVNKIAKLRIFPDQDDKMNLSVVDVDGELLAVSQFTLYGDLNDGNRPSFTKAMAPPLRSPCSEIS